MAVGEHAQHGVMKHQLALRQRLELIASEKYLDFFSFCIEVLTYWFGPVDSISCIEKYVIYLNNGYMFIQEMVINIMFGLGPVDLLKKKKLSPKPQGARSLEDELRQLQKRLPYTVVCGQC